MMAATWPKLALLVWVLASSPVLAGLPVVECNGRELSDNGTLTPGDPQTVNGTVNKLRAAGYRIEIAVSSVYVFSLCEEEGATASFDASLCLFGLSGRPLAESDDVCGSRPRLEVMLTAGEYFLAVSAARTEAGDFRLAHRRQDLPACNGRTVLAAATITPGVLPQTVSGSVTAVFSTGYVVEADADSTYTFSLCAEGAAATYDTWMCLFDAAGNRLAQSDDACALRSQIVIELQAGTYTLAVSGFSTREGDYTLVYFRESLIDCNNRPVLPAGTIAPGTLPQTVSGSVTAATSAGYVVEADAEAVYTFSLCAEGAAATYDTWMCLFDAAGNRLAQSDDACALRSQIVIELQAGTYTLAVSGFSTREGDFTLVYSRETLIDCNSRPVLPAGTIAPGTLPQTVSGSVTAATSAGYVVEADAEAVYTFSLCAEGAAATYDTWMCLFDAAGNRLAQSDDACALRSQIVIGLQPGTYTLAVSGFSTRAGDFTLVYFREAVIACGDKPVALSGTTIFPTLVPQTVQGTVDAHSATGYRVVIDVDSQCAFTLCSNGGTANFDSRLCLFDADGDLVAHNDNFCGLLSRLSLNLAAGEYTLAVASASDGAGSYTLAYSSQRPFNCSTRALVRAERDLVPSPSPAVVAGSVSLLAGTLYRIVQRFDGTCRFGFCAEGGSADFDTLLCLFDASGRLITQNDDFCGRRSEIAGLELEAGTYFIAVSGSQVSSGRYRLSYSSDVRLDCAGSGVVPSGTTLAPTPAALAVSGRLESTAAISYGIDLGYKGLCRFGFCEAPGRADFAARLCLFDSEGRLIALGRDGCRGPEEIEIELAPGRYVLAVSAPRDASGAFTLAYSAEPDRACSGHAVLPASRQLTAGPVARTAQGVVTSAAATSYEVNVDFDGTCRFTFCRDGGGADFDTVLCLFDARGSLVAEADDQCGELSELVVDLEQGRYELVVSGAPAAAGTYTLAYSCTTGLLCGGRPVVASGVTLVPSPVPQNFSGRLDSMVSASFDVALQFDGTCVFGFCDAAGTDFDATLCLFDATGRPVAESRDACRGLDELRIDLEAGTYQLAVSARVGVTGTYALSYRCETELACSGRAVVASDDLLIPSPLPQSVRGRVGSATATGYDVDVSFAGLHRFGFCADGGSADYDTYLCLYDRKGMLIAESDDACRELSEIRVELAPDRYVLVVGGAPGESGSYSLTYSAKTDLICVERAVVRTGIDVMPTPTAQRVNGEVAGTAPAPAYAVDLAYAGKCTFSLCGGAARFDSVLCLYDARGREIARDDNTCGSLSEITASLAPGDYTLAVSTAAGETGGAYELLYLCEPAETCGGRPIGPELETLLPAVVPRTLEATLGPVLADRYGVEIDVAGACRFDLCSPPEGDALDTTLCLLGADGRLIASNDDACGPLSALELELAAGRYTLVVAAGGEGGAYSLEYSCTPPGTACAGRPIEPSGEVLSALPLPGVVEGSLPAAAAVSYRVEIPFDGYCILGFCSDGGSAAFDASLCLFDAGGELVAEGGECEGGSQITAQLLAGVYELAISAPPGESGPYSLAYRCLPSCDARPALPGGEVLSPSDAPQVLAGELQDAAALAFPIALASPGRVTMSFCLEGAAAAFNASLCLLDASGSLLASNDDACGELAALSLCLDAGTYVLVVSGHGPGGGAFRLVYERETECGDGCPVPRGAIEPVTEFRTVAGELTPGTTDVYSFSLEEESVFTATFCRDGGIADFVTFLCLRSGDGGIATDTGGGCDRGAEIEQTLSPGDYTISVARSEGVSGAYTMAFRAATIAPAPFVRADCNGDGEVDVSDAFTTLRALSVAAGAVHCEDACDSNDDGAVNIADAVNTLGVLFLQQGTIPPPETCGVDPTDDEPGCGTPPAVCQ